MIDESAAEEETTDARPIIDELHSEDSMQDLTPETAIVDSLNSALLALREEADQLEKQPLDERAVEAAEHVAELATDLDEQIGSIARADDD